MKTIFIILAFIFSSSIISGQDNFVLKSPDTLQLKKEFIESDFGANSMFTYFAKNYKATSKKKDIKLDPDFNNKECGFTISYEFGIEYTFYECGEAAPVTEHIILPKTSLPELKKWIQAIHTSQSEENTNIWYGDTNEYGPKDKQVGCYYKIKQTDTKSIITTWCGC